MARWLAKLEGSHFDLEEFPRWFPSGELFAVEEAGSFFIVGKALDTLPDAESVRNVSIRAVHEFSATISVLGPTVRKPTIGSVIREHENGGRDVFVFITGVGARAKAGAVLTVGGDTPRPMPTQAQDLLSAAQKSTHLRTALTVFADPTPSWPLLYRVMEEIEQYLGEHVDAAGLCSGNERQRFTRTSNTAEVAGTDSRHAQGKFEPPADPMERSEGVSFIKNLLKAALSGRP